MILDRLNFIENKYDELSVKISDPSIMANQKEWRKLCKEHADLEVIVNKYKEYKEATEELEANKEMLSEESDQEKGIVLKVDPNVDSTVKSGSEVKLTVSGGEGQIKVPNFAEINTSLTGR